MSEQFVRKLTTWIVHNLVDKNTPFYICMFEEVTYYKLVTPLIQYKLIEKVDCKGWFKKLMIKVDLED